MTVWGILQWFIDLVKPDTGSSGVAAMYGSSLELFNKDQYETGLIDEEGYAPLPGGELLVRPPDPICPEPEPLGLACQEFWFSFFGIQLEWCVCTPLQLGGPPSALNFNAKYDIRPEGQNQYAGLPGDPILFDSNKTGAEMWWHYASDPVENQYAEIKHDDGTVARFEYAGQLSKQGYQELHRWRLDWVRDPFDNLTEYTYNSSGMLVEIQHPSGITEKWEWINPSWIGTGPNQWDPANYSGIEITFEYNANVLSEFTWGMVFNGTDHFGSELYRVYRPASKYVPDPGTGNLYDETQEATAYNVTQYEWTSGRITKISHFRETGPIAPNPNPSSLVDIESVTYDSQGRVLSRTNLLQGATWDYKYNFDSVSYGSAPETLETSRATTPDGDVSIYEYGVDSGRVYRTIRRPALSSRPRQQDENSGENAGLAHSTVEPEEVRIDREYGPHCVCQKPSKVSFIPVIGGNPQPARITEYEYYPDTYPEVGMLWKVHVPDPSDGVGQVTYEYAYDKYASTKWSQWRLKKVTTPDGIFEYSYNWIARGNEQLHGRMPADMTVTAKDVRIQQDTATEVATDIVETTVFDFTTTVQGLVKEVTSADGVKTTFAYDSQGRPATVTRGSSNPVTHTFVYDTGGRISSFTTNSSAPSHSAQASIVSGPSGEPYQVSVTDSNGILLETRFHYDRWGNPAVVRSRSRDSNDQKHGGTGRDWIRSEWHYHGSRLLDAYTDRRPLDADSSGTVAWAPGALMLRTSYSYTPGGRLTEILNPSGSTTEVSIDGYGTLYKSITRRDNTQGAPQILHGKSFIDPYLAVSSVFQDTGSDHLWTLIERNDAGAVTAVTEPTTTAPTGYTGDTGGARREFTRDALGRVTTVKVLDDQQQLLAQRDAKYDQLGRVIKATNHVLGVAGGGTHVLVREFQVGNGVRIGEVEWTGGYKITYGYDADGRLANVVDNLAGGGNTSTWSHHPGTDFVSKVVRLARDGATGGTDQSYTVEYDVDNLGRVQGIKETGHNGAATPLVHQFDYNSLSQVDTYTDPTGKVENYLLDALGRVVKHTVPGNDPIVNTSTYVDYTGTDSRSKVLRYDDLGHETAVHYDFAGRPFILQHPGADPANEPSDTAGSRHKPLSWLRVYDEASRLTDVYDGDGGHIRYFRDGLGRVIQRDSMTAATVEEISSYNTRDRLVRDHLGRITQVASFQGDVNDPGSMQQNINIARIQDSLGRLHEEQFLYSVGGPNPLTIKSMFPGAETRRDGLQYLDGLATSPPSADLHLEFGRDSIGRISQIRWDRTPGSGAGAVALADYTWMGGRRRSRTLHHDSATGDTTWSYDPYGRLNQLKHVVDTTTIQQFDYEYDAAGNLIREWYTKVDGSVGDRFVHDEHHRLLDAWLGVDTTTMNMSDAQLADPQTTKTFVEKLTYNLDGAHNRTSVDREDSGGTTTESYTLQDTNHPQGASNRYDFVDAVQFTYDDRGNLTFDGQHCFVYDHLNRLSEVWVVTEESSGSGGSTLTTTSSSSTTYLVTDESVIERARFDVLNRVNFDYQEILDKHKSSVFRDDLKADVTSGVVAVGPVGGGYPFPVMEGQELQLVAIYGYDAFNRRCTRAVIGDDNYMTAWDGWQETVEATNVGGSTVAQKQFVWGSILDEPVAYRKREGDDSWTDYHIYPDGGEGVCKIIDGNGSVVEQIEYSPYGTPKVYDGAGSLSGEYSTIGYPFYYRSVRRDIETGIYMMRHRAYSAALGRFLTTDPLGVWGDRANNGNGYAYVAASPLSGADPFGLQVRRNGKWWMEVWIEDADGNAINPRWSVVPDEWGVNGIPEDISFEQYKELYKNGEKDLPDENFWDYWEAALNGMTKGLEEWREAIVTGSMSHPLGHFVLAVDEGRWGDAAAIAGREVAFYVCGVAVAATIGRGLRMVGPNANDLHHVFGRGKHNLEPIVEAAGSQARAFKAIEGALQELVDAGVLKEGKVFHSVSVSVCGYTLKANGIVMNGKARLGTAFRNP